MKVNVKSLAELRKFAKKIAANLKGNEVLGLIGELGAGKTAFTKMLLKNIGISKKIASPTFVLMIPYSKNRTVYSHIDLYRLNSYKDIEALGVPENWQKKNNVYIIEWADKIKNKLPKNTVYFIFKIKGSQREITLKNVPKYFKI